MSERCSRIAGFYRLSVADRRRVVAEFARVGGVELELEALAAPIEESLLDAFVENVIGGFTLPFGVAANFLIDGREMLVPMVVEESSVVAAASNMARLVRATGGFCTEVIEDTMIGQVQLHSVPDIDEAVQAVRDATPELISTSNDPDSTLVKIGGGCVGVELRTFPASETDGDGDVLVVHFLVDCRDAMGANIVNTICEKQAPRLEELTGGVVGLRILSNLADRRRVRATCRVRAKELAFDGRTGEDVIDGIVAAGRFATYDPYRAATHNKGIMNGVDSVVLATGNDWRAMEAGAHAYAARDGRYRSLSRWSKDPDSGDLLGSVELPVQVGIVGGVTKLHPVARFSIGLLDVQHASDLGRVLAAVGLAQNLGALRALSTEGINRGHLRLHRRNLEMASHQP
ncbi:MAG: hydroxymethylglutaryl-CoA reductase, degradative [Deltaproteobacteria bacterium]|nr:hydroxymethylglutaryl-CoA reductase, degradative [Deltaproteobacteria bacterium]